MDGAVSERRLEEAEGNLRDNWMSCNHFSHKQKTWMMRVFCVYQ